MGELLAGLSIATDLGLGYPPEKTVRNALIASAVAAELGLDHRARADLFYAALLRYVGCTGFAHEAARWFGDEIAVARALSPVDVTRPREAVTAIAASVWNAAPGRRAQALVGNVVHARKFEALAVAADCDAGARFVRRFALGDGVAATLLDVNERWDGRGGPRRLAGDAIDAGARVFALADQVEHHHRAGGREAVAAMTARRSGGWFDPACVAAFDRCAEGVLAVVDAGAAWSAALDAEPEPHVVVPSWGVDDVVAAFADFADVKSPYLLGHSTGVARLAAGAAERLGFAEDERVTLRRAALLHDLGRVAVSTSLWDKAGPLSPPEWEQVRLHPYHTERILSRTPLLQPLARLAGAHHERPDGRGYHRGVTTVPTAARVLAAADVLHALTEPRPHRPARTLAEASAEVEAMAGAGALDPDAAAAVCAAAGTSIRPPVRARPAGLSEREVDVLRLLARGRTQKEIAADLGIAPGTVHTHVVHLYAKTALSTRAGIALFALEHGLI